MNLSEQLRHEAERIEKLNKKLRKRKLEFMQKLCIASWCLMAATVFADITLAWFERNPIPTTTQALIAFVSVFINGGYVTKNIIRNTSLNKHGIRIDDETGKHYMQNPHRKHHHRSTEGVDPPK